MIHFVGIGGIGMSALARLLLARGIEVSGSDVRRTALIERLEREGARVTIGHSPDNVEGAERLVVSSAIDSENPEVRRARERRLPIVRRGDLLAELATGKNTIAVAGTHGKTTTTAMIGAVLEAGDLDPTIALGGETVGKQTNARAGAGSWFLTESDESDGSFLTLDPLIGVVTNIEDDHVGSDEEFSRLVAAFDRFAAKISPRGMAVIGIDEPNAAALAQRFGPRHRATYGLHESAHVGARDVAFADWGTTAEITLDGKPYGRLALRVPGEINLINALPAVAIGIDLEIPFGTIAAALGEFKGVHRRFDILAHGREMTVVDDYAHHPTAIRETIATARRYHAGPVVVAFQPHRFTRTKYLCQAFVQSLRGADAVVLAPVYAASEPPIDGVSERSIGAPLAALGVPVEYVASASELPHHLRERVPAGALVLMLGAGDISAAAHRLADSLGAPLGAAS
ncbi:MAG: UDP-N-acetylmuramate--L-alanine ligase [Candidatus Eremiobacteraeota bacterium]|nr:UDP-N-acetylmuramate--L-alanine ligase [Candidatus Eremiobacteraeota bacterium]